MKMYIACLITVALIFFAGLARDACAGSDRFQTGFHAELGAIAARTVVGTALGILGGMFGPGGPYPCGRPYSGWGYSTPYEEAYAREAARIRRERYYRWLRVQRAMGRRDARMDFGYR